MNKKIRLLLLIVLVLVMVFEVSAAESIDTTEITNTTLSEMSDEECFVFLEKEGVIFPYRETDVEYWGPIVKNMIIAIEKNPEHKFTYNFTVMQAVANEIQIVINEFYRYGSSSQNSEVVPMYGPITGSLSLSTVVGEWTENYMLYNCYGYAIERGVLKNPGYFSGREMDEMMSIGEIAERVRDDLIALGHTNVQEWNYGEARDVCTGAKTIALRVRAGVDYHFMRLNDSDGEWYHKPGQTAILKYNHGSSIVVLWSNECYKRGQYYEADVYYDSTIVYFTYDAEHSYEYEYCGGSRHVLTCTTCGSTSGSPTACIVRNDVCIVCGHDSGGFQIMSHEELDGFVRE